MLSTLLPVNQQLFFLTVPPPLNIRESVDGASPNSSPLWQHNHSGSSVNTSCPSNGPLSSSSSNQYSPGFKNSMTCSPSHAANQYPQRHQNPLISPTPMPGFTTGHNMHVNQRLDLTTHQIASVNLGNSGGIHTVSSYGGNNANAMHCPSTRDPAKYFTFPSAELTTNSPISLGASGYSGTAAGQGESSHFAYDNNLLTSPVSSSVTTSSVMPSGGAISSPGGQLHNHRPPNQGTSSQHQYSVSVPPRPSPHSNISSMNNSSSKEGSKN